MHYVGMDRHITTLDLAMVDNAGRLVKSCKVGFRLLLHLKCLAVSVFCVDGNIHFRSLTF
jgi:hypothetical protein